jgi:hypothetical protein
MIDKWTPDRKSPAQPRQLFLQEQQPNIAGTQHPRAYTASYFYTIDACTTFRTLQYSKLRKGFVGCWCFSLAQKTYSKVLLLQRSRILSFAGPVHPAMLLLRFLDDPKYSIPE